MGLDRRPQHEGVGFCIQPDTTEQYVPSSVRLSVCGIIDLSTTSVTKNR
jgi:hypothetical protein